VKLPRLDGNQILRALERGGYRVVRIRGSHYVLRHPVAPRLVVVPVHGSAIVPAGTFRSILRQAELKIEDFLELLG
jgi:predicted RNA binding protein YcfA (HicA-like mRNA interferase family)